MKNRLDDYDQYKELSCEFGNIEMLNGKVLVEVDLNLTTESGLIIPFAGSLTESYDREGHCVRSGFIRGFSNECMYKKDGNQSLWKSEVEVEVGDEVWFDYIASIDSFKIFNNGKLYYVLPYFALYVVKRKINIHQNLIKNNTKNIIKENGGVYDIIMLNGYTLSQEIDNYDGFFITLYKNKRNPIVQVKYTGSNNEEYLDGEGFDPDIDVGDVLETFNYTMIKLENSNHLTFNKDEKYYVIQKRRFIYKH